LLVAGDDVQIIDFEGEPTKSFEERRRKYEPLRDVAGMLRSFDYVAAHVERGTTRTGEEGVSRAATILGDFRRAAGAAFLQGYEEGRGEALTERERALLELLMLEKAAYEICYEAANRPDWLIAPVCGLIGIADGLLAREAVDA
jgi:maltose alpha-D-glucosyltransferase/alpha-amylase